MQNLHIKIGNKKTAIDKDIFLMLLDFPYIQDYSAYKKAIESSEIKLSDLKDLAEKALTPYPLFFAPKKVVEKQIKDYDTNLSNKLPTKEEMRIVSRGIMKVKEIESILKDLARKQEFLKRRVLTDAPDNAFVGSIARKIAHKFSEERIAQEFRNYFGLDLEFLRKLSKKRVVEYLSHLAEKNNILVSFSSYDFMPQNIDRKAGFSGIAVKDKKFPYIFINTRDGDEEPVILETDGRQIFTLISMLVSIGMNKFVFSMQKGKTMDASLKKVFSIAGEILVPKKDLQNIHIESLDDIRQYAGIFKVTPSMFIMRLRDFGYIKKEVANQYLTKLKSELIKKENKGRRPSPVVGYGKYNGSRLSHEVVRAESSGKITLPEAKNALFKRGKIENSIYKQYAAKYR